MPVEYGGIPVRPVPFVERDRALRSHSELADSVQVAFSGLLQADTILANTISHLAERGWRGAVFGGWVRDQLMGLLTGHRPPPRDIDIVVDGMSAEDLRSIVGSAARENIFGGYSLMTTTTSLDIWRLERTFLIVRDRLPVAFTTLPSTTVFRINSTVFVPGDLAASPQLIDAGAVAAIRERSIDFQSSHVPFPHVQVGRAAMYAAKLAFTLGPEVRQFMREICGTADDVALVESGLSQFCPDMYLERAKHAVHEALNSE